MNGFLNILKPPGMTSHDVVGFVRKTIGIRKVGHTGTLDPEAAGVLPLCIGKATKAVQYIIDGKKTYRANIKFGTITDTQDKYGKVLSKKDISDISIRELQSIIPQFVGKIQQIPPLYSAIKHEGKRLYQYAHEGKNPPIKSREVEVFDISIVDKLNDKEFILDILCSKGTYVRTLCNDIGEKLGYGAYMSRLVRLESYPFKINESLTLEEISLATKNNTIKSILKSLDYVFEKYEKIIIKECAKKPALNGNPIYDSNVRENLEQYKHKNNLRLYIDEQFIGIGETCYDEELMRSYIKIKTLFV